MAGVVAAAKEVLSAGGLLVFPTETFYGLGARPDRPEALRRLGRLKAREGGKPVPLVAATAADVARVGVVPAPLVALTARFWPGPLTVVIRPRDPWPELITGTSLTIGVRIPGAELTRELAAAAGGLMTATSANFKGHPPASEFVELDTRVLDQADLAIDAGGCPGGAPSTIVAVSETGVVQVRRAGAIALDALTAVLGYAPEVCGS